MCVYFFRFLLKNDPPRPGRQENEEEKAKCCTAISDTKTILRVLRENRMILVVKISKKKGQFYVTLICSLNLRKNHMILVVKISKNMSPSLRLRAFSCTLFNLIPSKE